MIIKSEAIAAQMMNAELNRRTWGDILINVKVFGAVGDGVTDDTDAILKTFNASKGKWTVFFPPGVYLISSTIALTLDADISVKMDSNARVVTTDGFKGKVFQFLHGSSYENPHVVWEGGVIDASKMDGDAGLGLSYDSIWIQGAGRVSISKVTFLFGENHRIAHGDTGISIADSSDITISDCYFSGAPDNGIYITGDSDGDSPLDDGRDTIITGCHFNLCSVGITSKRSNQRIVISNNTFYRCRVGVVPLQASPDLMPGLGYIVSNNQFKFTQSVAIEMRISDGAIITGNRIEDLGYQLDGVTPHGAQVYGILLSGSKHCIVANNWIGFKDWEPPTSPTYPWGIFMKRYTYNSIDYYGSENYITGNLISGFGTGIREETSNDSNNIIHGNSFFNISTKAVDLKSGNTYLNPLYLGNYSLFVDSTGTLRIKNGTPTSDTDGTIVGTQS